MRRMTIRTMTESLTLPKRDHPHFLGLGAAVAACSENAFQRSTTHSNKMPSSGASTWGTALSRERKLHACTLIRQLDDERNHIVHWHPVQKVDLLGDGKSNTALQLMPPHFWHRAPAAAPITVQALKDFASKANFVRRSITMFYLFTTRAFASRLPDDARNTWREIFARPALYPPSNTHPLSLNYKAPETPPQSSEA
jgi:hypothetical protein